MDTNDDIPPHLRQMAKASEGGEDRTTHKPCLGVTFIDQNGVPYSFQYSHLYRLFVDKDCLVVEFSGHRVILEGRRLFAPSKDCLMHMLNQHKREFVEAIVGGEERNFSTTNRSPGMSERPVVTKFRVEVISN
ncbi:hypothetical protein [Limnoglobus roseus]|uniref:Uncharacterized protein n=1 Tax=Limnoglobus roseus TaxID=2598579 RepID=A0A5C1AIP3_9BACT|nr:hypothetical protein [Limnoglobus roseus]QEL19309.1 hypothetical protein PX52LOC_06374 [Limnoglobus roseus]